MKSVASHWFPLLLGAIVILVVYYELNKTRPLASPPVLDDNIANKKTDRWVAPDINTAGDDSAGRMIKYGRDLIVNTSVYFGPRGRIARISNGMNCQNCHIEAGTRLWGNNFSAVFSTYPKFRNRRGGLETVVQRVNDCFERSLNGRSIDSNTREMQAILAYMKWLGKDVPKGVKPAGAGIAELDYLQRAASPEKGRAVFQLQCSRCHGENGRGVLNANTTAYVYPPLWGGSSYNTAAGLYRISSFAGYVKNNMPFDVSKLQAQLTDEEAWDVAAFVNTQSRPRRDFRKDWPVIATKPVDYPFGPFADAFPAEQHKYGPFKPIQQATSTPKK
jgi:thiosulfate dehydrogenase